MKKILFLLISLTLFCIPYSAQSASELSSQPQAKKFDEFVFDDDNFQERTKRFAEALGKEPNAKAYVIAYDERIARYGELHSGYSIHYIKDYLAYRNDYEISVDRIVTIKGGLREKLDVEFFIVPDGANLPVPTPAFEPDKQIKCPNLRYVSAPAFVFSNTNSPLEFQTLVSSDTPEINPIYKWSVSAGKVISGQGTSSIIVERPTPVYESVTATVEIGGYSNECKVEKKSENSPKELLTLPSKVDEFEEPNCEMELANLNYLRAGLVSDPSVEGYVIVYGGKYGKYNEVKARIARIKAVFPNRVKFIDGGFREKLSIELWLTIKGESLPTPTPTVDVKDIKLKGRAKIYNAPCM